MDATVSDIVAENRERREELFADYDPIAGTGSPIERREFPLTPNRTIRVPVQMYEDGFAEQACRHGSAVETARKEEGLDEDEAILQFNHVRCQYDFEFWAATAAVIELDEETRRERGMDKAPLRLNRAQRMYFKKLWAMWAGGVPVRIILLKARQWGGSTLTQTFFFWVQKTQRENWNSFICNLTNDQSRNIRRMYTRIAEHYPAQLGSVTLNPYEGSTNVKQIEETDSIVGVTSIESKDSIRTYNIHMAHLSEVGYWPSTPKVNAEDFAGGITGAVSNVPGTIIVEESTARGVGTYFHGHWQDAQKGVSSYTPIFVSWMDIPKYTKEVDKPADFVEQYFRPSSSTPSEKIELARRLWSMGATLEGIRWYFAKLADFKGDLNQMRREYPSEPQEAFQSTGNRFFGMDLTSRIRSQSTGPRETGAIRAEAVKEDGAFEDVRIKTLPADESLLKVWRRPGDKVWWDGELLNPGGKIIKRRFCAFADFGGKTKEADWSVISIGDRIKMLRGGPAEVVARLRVHMRPDLFAWRSAQLAYLYDKALLAYEINRHRKGRGDEKRGYEPEWSLAVIEEIMDEYPNLYLRTVEDRIDEPVRYEVGFHTNQSTKPLILNTLDGGLDREPAGQTYFDPDIEFVDEMETFERKDDGSLGAVEGNHDDIIISSAGTAWLALKYMDPPTRVEPGRKRKRKPASAASF